jgi:ketosteroid isomerase-like protein
MHANAELIRSFYAAFAKRDSAAMNACYASDIEFHDPVFQTLRGDDAKRMWRMLCARAKDLDVVASKIEADDRAGRAHWVATYTFSSTGNRVENRIDASFEFKDGRIVRHQDRFDLYRWARQALGLKGLLLGWLPPVQAAVRKQAAAGLRSFKD